ncbi:glycosyltransferase [Mycobacterium sp. IDR2000157661]|uniref:glycosyltransferase n=1 Tax=Mycobacterium sp. IDR2000157661 TaxID=2867005 RepID=UPI001EEF2CA7|nr:glycosyltransferase [Mycobacterium sp. IDR2000157661]ULE35861.1 glycosyltransferase [Mycobacterium sp. IDR2000157661]
MLWLSPWMRPLARVYVEALGRRGVHALLVTSDQHPESGDARDYEIVLDPRLRAASTWSPTLDAYRRIRRWRADVVVTELVRDPRWIALAGSAPRVNVVHDDRVHDVAERRPRYESTVFDRWADGAAATVTFSDFVAAAVQNRRDLRGGDVYTVPLTSDLDSRLVPPFAAAADRRDFAAIGRLNPYKNLDVTLQAWAAHVQGSGWRGDRMLILGDGYGLRRALPKHTVWRAGTYRYSDVVETLAAAKGCVAHYRRASQSGVQVLAMQLGVTPIVSTVGALAEFQPPGCPPIGVDDVEGLVGAFDQLADPVIAVRHGVTAAVHYAAHHAADRAAEKLITVFDDVRRAAS